MDERLEVIKGTFMNREEIIEKYKNPKQRDFLLSVYEYQIKQKLEYPKIKNPNNVRNFTIWFRDTISGGLLDIKENVLLNDKSELKTKAELLINEIFIPEDFDKFGGGITWNADEIVTYKFVECGTVKTIN